MAPSAEFLSAASYLSTAPSHVQTSTKLELYGLFKFVTASPLPLTPRPSIFDMTGRAKWDAWSSVGKKFTSLGDAENRYLEVARSLGWSEDSPPVETPAQAEESDSDNIWDDDSQPRGGSGSTGMGGAVSTMMNSDNKEVDESIHGLAVSDNITGLSELFHRQPGADANQLDEFGYTPLHLACDRGHISAVKFLLSKGADPTIRDPDGLSPAELAAVAGHAEVEICLRPLGTGIH